MHSQSILHSNAISKREFDMRIAQSVKMWDGVLY